VQPRRANKNQIEQAKWPSETEAVFLCAEGAVEFVPIREIRVRSSLCVFVVQFFMGCSPHIALAISRVCFDRDV
jgi:hypothetical protein